MAFHEDSQNDEIEPLSDAADRWITVGVVAVVGGAVLFIAVRAIWLFVHVVRGQ